MRKPIRAFRMAFPILKYLALNPDRTAYAAAKETKIDIPTTYETMRILVEAHLVKVHPEGKHTTGLLKESYSVTPQGIVALFQAIPEYVQISKTDARDIAEKQTAFLPLIFGKWKCFRDSNVEELAYDSLLIAVQHSESEVDRLAKVVNGETLEPTSDLRAKEPMHRHAIYEGMLVGAWASDIEDDEQRERWLQVVRSDKELRAIAEGEIMRLQANDQESLEVWKLILSTLHGQSESRGYSIVPMGSAVFGDLEQHWKYMQCVALDEGGPLPVLAEMTNRALEEFLKKRGMLPRRRKSRLSKNYPTRLSA